MHVCLQAGLEEGDEELAEVSRRLKVPVVVAVNKCENPKTGAAAAQVQQQQQQ